MARDGARNLAIREDRLAIDLHDASRMMRRLALEASVLWMVGCGSSDDGALAVRTRTTAEPAAPIVDCPGESRPASPPGVPDVSTVEAWGDAKSIPPNLIIDVSKCEPKRWHAWLPLGSSWVQIAPAGDPRACRVWLGGETEGGQGGQYCEFSRTCARTTIEVRPVGRDPQGGPPLLEAAACTAQSFK